MASYYRLTTKNAHEYVDKYIVGKLFHNWPLKVKQLNDGDYYYFCEYEYKFCPNCGAKMDKE